MYFKIFFFVIITSLFSTSLHSASMNMIGEKGDPSKIDRVVKIKMYDNYYEPNLVKIKKGETIKFVVENLGEMVHEYNIGTKEMHIKHQPEMQRLVEHGILLVDKIDHIKMKEMAIIKLLREMRKEGKIMLVSTHNLGSVPEFCDRTILIKEDRKSVV